MSGALVHIFNPEAQSLSPPCPFPLCPQSPVICTSFVCLQAFNPAYAATSLNHAMVQDMAKIMPIAQHNLIPDMLKQLPAYLSLAAACPGFNTQNVAEFSEGILKWWKMNHPQFPAWAIAARIVFAMLPSSAPCERVFSLVECMFGQDQLSSLADQLQGSVMLRYNKRAVG